MPPASTSTSSTRKADSSQRLLRAAGTRVGAKRPGAGCARWPRTPPSTSTARAPDSASVTWRRTHPPRHTPSSPASSRAADFLVGLAQETRALDAAIRHYADAAAAAAPPTSRARAQIWSCYWLRIRAASAATVAERLRQQDLGEPSEQTLWQWASRGQRLLEQLCAADADRDRAELVSTDCGQAPPAPRGRIGVSVIDATASSTTAKSDTDGIREWTGATSRREVGRGMARTDAVDVGIAGEKRRLILQVRDARNDPTKKGLLFDLRTFVGYTVRLGSWDGGLVLERITGRDVKVIDEDLKLQFLNDLGAAPRQARPGRSGRA